MTGGLFNSVNGDLSHAGRMRAVPPVTEVIGVIRPMMFVVDCPHVSKILPPPRGSVRSVDPSRPRKVHRATTIEGAQTSRPEQEIKQEHRGECDPEGGQSAWIDLESLTKISEYMTPDSHPK